MENTQRIREQFYGKDARVKLMKGVDAVANAVKVTMGAKGRNVVTSYGHTTKDGVTVARDVEILDDEAARKGAMFVKAASVKTCDVVGDGTTQVCVLTQALVHGGMELIDAGKDSQELKKEMEACKEKVLASFAAVAKPATDVREIANISANDAVIGGLVAEAVGSVGVDGLVTIENSYGDTCVEIVEGMQVDRGLISPAFVTQGERRRAEYENARVLIFKDKIHDVIGFAKVMEAVVNGGSPFVIFADDYDIPVLRLLEINRMRGISLLALKNPLIYHDETLEDMAIFTGATVVTEADGFKNFNMGWLGKVEKITSTQDRTVMRSLPDRKEAIEKRVKEIYDYAEQFKDTEKRNVEKRGARLKGKMAIVKLAAATEESGKEMRDRIEDAIYASQAALEKGIVPGGGYVYLLASQALKDDSDGARVIRQALESPMRQIVRNAGKNDAEIVQRAKKLKKGYNVVTEKFEDMMQSGVIDPLKVPQTAFENALSVAVLALTTEVVIAEREIKIS